MTTQAIEYRDGLELAGRARDDAMELMRRLIERNAAKSTDQAETTWAEPVENYRDDALFEAEKELIFKRVPLPLALSVEIPAGSWKAIEAVGVPVLITRDEAGQIHAMLNVCRHRGAELCPAGTGSGRAILCPYHAWSYSLAGELNGIYGESTFGGVDRASRSLHPLPAEERHGVVFVGLTPGRPLDLDTWLGDMAPVLADLRLEELHQFSSRMMPGPNWKVTLEGYLEGYHFAALHKNTVFKTNLGNLSVFDSFGPHARVAFGLRPLLKAGDPETWKPVECVGPIVWVFPGLAIAGGWRDRTAVSFPLPGVRRDETMTEQRIFMRRPPGNDREQHEAEIARDWFYDVTYGEDYVTGFGVQRGVQVMPDGDTQLFGRNEIGVQHLHRTINTLMAKHSDGSHPQPRVAGPHP